MCGRRRAPDRYRLPLPVERQPFSGGQHHPGEAPRATAEADPLARCGIFQGQRRCRKAEARQYGYGGGNDPLSAAFKLGTLLLDPDADVAPVVAVPKAAVRLPR